MAARMKGLAPTPSEVLEVVRRAEPSLPPAVVPEDDPSCALNLRLRVSTVRALEASAAATGRTMKLVLMQALQAAGVEVAAVDLEDRSPEKMRRHR